MNLFGSVRSWFDMFFTKNMASFGGRKTTSLEHVSEDSALNYAAVWCATQILCGAGSTLPLPLYKGLDDERRTKMRAHPVSRILNGSPNNEQTSCVFRSLMWQYQVNWGNAYAEIVREGNDPDAPLDSLYALHPTRVSVGRNDNGDLRYTVRDDRGQNPVELEPWQVLHIPSIITTDGIMGRGVIEHARESIGAGIAAEKYGAHWFGGAGVPRVVIEYAKTWSPEQSENFRKEWDELHEGPNGRRVAVLQGGAKAVPLSLSANDSQFLETRQFGIEEIARWYNIPPHMLHHLLRATFNNVEELGINFVRYSLIPWLKIWEQCCWQKLLTREEQDEYFVEHNVDALQRGNQEARGNWYQKMTSAALMTRNECRKLENLEPVEGGDTFLVQGAMVPLDEDGKPESKFVDGGSSGAAPAADIPANTSITAVASSLYRVIGHDLTRFLTKESKAMANFAKKPEEFISLVDDFYASHTAIVRDELTETFGALGACGAATNTDVFVTAWVEDGRKVVIEASGLAHTADELKAAVQSVIESRTWTERPLRAVESVKNKGVVA